MKKIGYKKMICNICKKETQRNSSQQKYCKECSEKEKTRKRMVWGEKYWRLSRVKEKRQTEEYREKQRNYCKTWRKKNRTRKLRYDRISRLYIKKQLRDHIVFLYTHGKLKCICGEDIQELHHTDPKTAIFEERKFGTTTTYRARQYQIKQFKTNPNYIQPLCRKCHFKTHKTLRGRSG